MTIFQPISKQSDQIRGVLTVIALVTAVVLASILSPLVANAQTTVSYPIVDTGQDTCYDNSELIDCPAEGEVFYGQDAQFTGNMPSYTDNGDGTVTDNVTGLVWTQDQSDQSMDWSQAPNYCETLTTGDITDWRVPNIKELWSIRDFSTGWPWVDTDYFHLVGEDSRLRLRARCSIRGRATTTWSIPKKR